MLKKSKTYRKTYRAYVDDPTVSVGDLNIFVDNPKNYVNNPDRDTHNTTTVCCEGEPPIIDDDPPTHVGDPPLQNTDQVKTEAEKPAFRIRYPFCPHCNTCTCPRGDYKEHSKELNLINPFRKPVVPCLLELPLVVPIKYKNNPPKLKLRSRRRRRRHRRHRHKERKDE